MSDLDSKLDGYKMVDNPSAAGGAKIKGPQYGDARVDGNINVAKAGKGIKGVGTAKGPKIKVKGKIKTNKVKSKTGVCDKDFKKALSKHWNYISIAAR